MNWTDEQSRAVTFRGNNVLVSAGAGAGKTAVLVERIKKQVIDERVSITKRRQIGRASCRERV